MVLPNENFTFSRKDYFKATLKGFCISIKCSVSLKMNCYQAYFSHLSGLNVNQQQAVLSYLYGAKVLLASNCKSTVNLFSMQRYDLMTLFDFICQVRKVKRLQPYQVAPTARLPFKKGYPKPRKSYCQSRPGLPVREHHGKGGLQSCRDNRKCYIIRCACKCVWVWLKLCL